MQKLPRRCTRSVDPTWESEGHARHFLSPVLRDALFADTPGTAGRTAQSETTRRRMSILSQCARQAVTEALPQLARPPALRGSAVQPLIGGHIGGPVRTTQLSSPSCASARWTGRLQSALPRHWRRHSHLPIEPLCALSAISPHPVSPATQPHTRSLTTQASPMSSLRTLLSTTTPSSYFFHLHTLDSHPLLPAPSSMSGHFPYYAHYGPGFHAAGVQVIVYGGPGRCVAPSSGVSITGHSSVASLTVELRCVRY